MEERKKGNVPEGYSTTVENFIPCIYKSVDNQMITMLKQYGYDYTTDNGDILFFNENTKDILLDLADKKEKGYRRYAEIPQPYQGFHE